MRFPVFVWGGPADPALPITAAVHMSNRRNRFVHVKLLLSVRDARRTLSPLPRANALRRLLNSTCQWKVQRPVLSVSTVS